jgi:hypothetical protein
MWKMEFSRSPQDEIDKFFCLSKVSLQIERANLRDEEL